MESKTKVRNRGASQEGSILQLLLKSPHESSVTKKAEMVQAIEYYLLDDLEVL